MSDLERTLSHVIEKTSKGFRVILLNGQRQVGKSTLLKNISKKSKRNYVSLDNIKFRQLAKNDPELFLQQNPPPVIIDEVQYAPELFPYIKIYVDQNRNTKGAFWLTGSQKYKLMDGVKESLAGRIAILELMGLSYNEKAKQPFLSKPFLPSYNTFKKTKKLTIQQVYKLIWEGQLPEPVVNKNIDREQYYSSYIQSYIERDVKDFYNIERPIQFFNFVSVVAAQTAKLLNYTSLARDVGIDVKTAQAWMGILERSEIVYLLRPYSPNITNRIIKTPKMYFLDTGLCSYLTRWNTPESLMSGAMDGAILETHVIGETLKSYLHNGKEPLMYLYRDTDQKEIDLVIEENGTLYPIEIKKTTNPQLSDCKYFNQLNKLNKKVGLGAIICLQPERIPLNRNIVSIPVWEI
ncbi:MAG: ATP-binding protein [Endomicrobium sp.]|jgi:predicted AAA+ superfamily ATPase|uniref:ATP-binding protein n=1 Tax=Candidatus Endomicrobiellum cubanum TaxID=3242325 RepID=UPI00282230FE|nr:ATP-binding protein [Endomicrobium sp.]